jgi:hypothetical protein
MRYVLLFHESAAHFALRDNPEKSADYWAAWNYYITALRQAGIVQSGEGLMPPYTATTIGLRDGRWQIHDGPYAESKEMLGGFFVIEVPDLHAALEWATRAPSSSYCCTEVRPLLPVMKPDRAA